VADLNDDKAGKRMDGIVVLLRIAALVLAIVAERGPGDRSRPFRSTGTPTVPSGWI
jgi:hypothetical protein